MNSRNSDEGFTLIETSIVLVVLALVVALVAGRGPSRSPGLEAHAAAREIVQILRAERTRAIAAHRPVDLTLDMAQHRYRVNGKPMGSIAGRLAGSSVAVLGGPPGNRFATIVFAPDGSTSGARIEVRGGSVPIRVGVDRLTGRVSIGYEH